MDQVYMIWIVVSAACIVLEMFIASFAVIWFGIGAAAAAAISYFNVGGDEYTIALQWTVFLVVSVALFLLFRKKLTSINSKTVNNFGVDRLIGETAIVTEEIDNITGSGKVDVGGEIWLAVSKNDENIPVDVKVVITKIDGTKVIVLQVKE